MNDILVPLAPADIIDQLAQLKLQLESAKDADLHAHFSKQRHLLQLALDRLLPGDDVQAAMQDLLYEVYADLHALEGDMRDCESRSDFGPAFVALAQSYLATLQERDMLKAELIRQLRDAIAKVSIS